MDNQFLTTAPTQEQLDAKFMELYNKGLRTSVILAKMETEFGYSIHTLYKKLAIEDLKKKARSKKGTK